MDRRGVLKGLGAATAAALWPGWLREAFAGQPCGVMRGSATLAAAIQRAHQGYKPLLILVIPESDYAKPDRGMHFGEWLNHGSDRDLAALACAELVCAEMGAVRQLFPSAPPKEEPAVLTAQVDRAPASLRVALEAFPEHEPVFEEGSGGWADRIDQCIARTGATIRKALLGDAEALQSRAAALRARLDGAQLQLAQRILDGGEAPLSVVLGLAPLLAAELVRGRKKLIPALAAAARAAYCRQRVPGSKWARYDGCTDVVEGEPIEGLVDCGMGYVPSPSRRFLWFFTRSPLDRSPLAPESPEPPHPLRSLKL